jgi:hypothetical protein
MSSLLTSKFLHETTTRKKWLKNPPTEVDFRAVLAAAATEEVAAATEVVAVAVVVAVVAVVAVAEVGRTRKTSGRRAQS